MRGLAGGDRGRGAEGEWDQCWACERERGRVRWRDVVAEIDEVR